MFATVSIPFAEFQSLPTPQDRWALAALVRYCNKAGECWPSLKQLGTDLGVSESTACRWLQRLAACGVFEVRRRTGNGRYRYRIAQRFLPRWPGKASTSRLAATQAGPPQLARPKESKPSKQDIEARSRPRFGQSKESWDGLPWQTDWEPRLWSWRQSRFWLPQWGPKPNEPGCFAPPSMRAGGG